MFYSLPLAQRLVLACRHHRIFNCQLPALLQKVLGSLMATATATTTAKSNRFRFAKQQLCRCITFFIHFFAVTARVRREMPYFTICRGRQLSFFLPELWYSPLELNSSIWRIKRDGISVIKFEATQIHFLSDVFVAVAVVVGSADYWWGLEMWVLFLHSHLFFKQISPPSPPLP